MGGGPTESDDERTSMLMHDDDDDDAGGAAAPPAASTTQGMPVTTATAVVAALSAIAFSLLGMGPRVGLIVGAMAGAYAAARPDAIGERTRESTGAVVNNIAQSGVVHTIANAEIVQSLRAKAGEYEPKAKKAVRSTIAMTEERVIPAVAGFAAQVHDKIKEHDGARGYLDSAENKVAELDHRFGVSHALVRTTQAVRDEILTRTQVP